MDNLYINIHLITTWFMVGLIWFVQVVQYPLFAKVGHAVFDHYYKSYAKRVSLVVVIPMLLELFTAFAILSAPLSSTQLSLAWIGIVLLLLIWGATIFLQVPQHRVLDDHFSNKAHMFLVQSNWVRTILWSIRGILVMFYLG